MRISDWSSDVCSSDLEVMFRCIRQLVAGKCACPLLCLQIGVAKTQAQTAGQLEVCLQFNAPMLGLSKIDVAITRFVILNLIGVVYLEQGDRKSTRLNSSH